MGLYIKPWRPDGRPRENQNRNLPWRRTKQRGMVRKHISEKSFSKSLGQINIKKEFIILSLQLYRDSYK